MALICTYRNISYLFVLFVLISSSRYCIAKEQCSDSTYNPGSQFDKNLKLLFPALLNAIPQSPSYFSNASIGGGSDKVFGLALCRGDTSNAAGCKSCLDMAIGNITKNCNKTSGIVWFDSCMLRYSTKYFFSIATTLNKICITKSSTKNATSGDGLASTINTLMSNLSFVASNSNQPKLFAVGHAILAGSSNTVLYGLAECTKDLSAVDCYACLKNNTDELITPQCNKGKIEAKIVGESCYLWYDDSRFYYKYLNHDDRDDSPSNGGKINKKTIIIATVCGVAGLAIIVASINYLWKRIKEVPRDTVMLDPRDTEDVEIPAGTRVYAIEELRSATGNFSPSKILGAGGFGVVYEATIDGILAAVKSFHASQVNVEKLKKELSIVANIEHPNILKLLGYCFEEDHYLFVYEYMPNGSLDKYWKDPASRQNLNWLTRLKIIKGIANGLYTLHNCFEKSMIHADLKLENILLSMDMTAKIADFDLLRVFEIDETHQSTNIVRGTRGYMAPEVIWAPRTHYSVKSDVYSFGIMVLEIVTGERSILKEKDSHPNLTSFVWDHWNCKTQHQVIDPYLDSQTNFEQIVRCIHIGLLCVQHEATERPDMLQVLDMLNNKKPLPQPSIPGLHKDAMQQYEPAGFLPVLESV